MKAIVLAAILAALCLAAPAAAKPTKTFPPHRLSDVHLGKSKAELKAQRTYSAAVVAAIKENGSWRLAPRREHCWSVPWAQTCNKLRLRLRAHRWLATLARERYEQLYAPATGYVTGAAAYVRARAEAARLGVTGGSWNCLATLVGREGGWDPHTWNHAGSGAYGMPQALPGDKMSSAGADWADNPATQIRWMIGYVDKFGGACGALAYQIAHGSY